MTTRSHVVVMVVVGLLAGPGNGLASQCSLDEVVDTGERTVEVVDGRPRVRETSRCQRVLFEAREPAVLATFPDGYIASCTRPE